MSTDALLMKALGCAVSLCCALQRKLTSLEEQHSALSASHKEKTHALDLTLAEAARLDKEVAKLLASVERLESRWVWF
jgi:chromosome segregation ATPase